MHKFLIVKTSSLGDIIQAFPAVSYLRHKFPHAVIDWVVEQSAYPLVAAHAEVNNALSIDSKLWRKNLTNKDTWQAMRSFKARLQKTHYDVVFDLQANLKSGLITYLAAATTKVGFGWKSAAEKPNVLFTDQRYNPEAGQNIREDYLSLLTSYFNDTHPYIFQGQKLTLSPEEQLALQSTQQRLLSHPRKIMLCPGSAWPNKQVSMTALVDFLRRLQQHSPALLVLAWGTPAEWAQVEGIQREFPQASVILERHSLPVLQNLMDEMDVVIAMDSLPLHLAGTTRTATFSLFGPSLALKYKPQGKQHVALQGQCPYAKTFEKRCPELRTCKTGACLKSLGGETLFDFFIQNM